MDFDLKQAVTEGLSNYELTMSIMITVAIAVITVLIILYFGVWKFRTKVLPSQTESPRKLRFRKRDKVLFYGRKMLRKVRSFTKNTMTAYSGRGRGVKKRQIVVKLAKRLLRMRRDPTQPQLRVKEPPQSFLEADASELQETDQRLPSEVLYMLKSVRVFGHFKDPLFLELVKHMESRSIPAGGYLFRIGDMDDSIYVVQSGKIDVYITESDGTEYTVKELFPGDSVHSLLSVLDVLTGHQSSYKTVSAKAIQDSTILQLPVTAFQSMFERFPESLVRVVQVIMVRLQRVTFTALHNYLGLTSELINSVSSSSDIHSLSIHTILSSHSTASPQKRAGNQFNYSTIHEGHVKPPEPANKPIFYVGTEKEDGGIMVTAPSDFDVACLQARVSSLDTTSVQPPKQPEDTLGISSSRQRPRKSLDLDIDPEIVINLAKKDMMMLLKLKDESLLEGKLHLMHLKAGNILIKQGDQDASLVFVVIGTMHVLQQIVGESTKEALLFEAQPGDFVGSLAVLTGEPSFFTIRAKTDVRVITISKNDFYTIMKEQPSVVLNVAYTTLARMTPFVRQTDFALDWMMIEAGKALFRQGDHSECIYIVLTGRLRSVITLANGKKELTGEYGRGELVGIVEVLTQTERATTVIAVRDTELAKMPAELLNLIKRKYPQIVTRLIHLLGQRILGHLQNKNTVALAEHIQGTSAENRQSVSNLATVAVLPISKDVPLTNLTLELQHSLNAIGPTTRLTSDIVKTRLGSAALDSVNEFRLFSWLGQQEDIHRMVLYQCDYTMTKWSKCCIRQADCILIVGLAENEPTVGEMEIQMENISVRAQKELILLHKEDAEKPRRTVDWLNARGWCSSHHHIRCPKRIFSRRSMSQTLEMYQKLFQLEPDRQSDCSRLARSLTGTSIGLVLGGGGARGLAHVGLIRAMIEAGIPIDIVGGTSIGSIMGALWCEERNLTRFTQRAREWSMIMSSLWQKIIDLTYPMTSMFTGSTFNKSIESVFKDRQIEDLWIPYFCVTTDISNSSMRVHRHGNLWRYVRSSMSLSGYLPPLCDPIDGHLLLDGGYVNNLPADVMRTLGAQNIFAVDVGSESETQLTNYGDELSGWWLLWKRWNPWAAPVRVPDMTDIQSRLAYVSCVRQLEVVKNSDYCEYIRPPIDKYQTLQFASFDEICDVGYNHGKTLFAGWKKGGLIQKLFNETSLQPKVSNIMAQQQQHTQPDVPVMAYFTDLAELVSKIEEPAKPVFYGYTDSEESEENDMIAEDDEFEDDYDDDIILDENTVYSNGTKKTEPTNASETRNRRSPKQPVPD